MAIRVGGSAPHLKEKYLLLSFFFFFLVCFWSPFVLFSFHDSFFFLVFVFVRFYSVFDVSFFLVFVFFPAVFFPVLVLGEAGG